MTETVWLQRPSEDVPWGFRLTGGRDHQAPVTVQKVTSGSIASTGLSPDDVILRIGNVDTYSLTYSQVMDVLKTSGNLLELTIASRGGSHVPKVEAESNMASDALHDLFQDMYRYSDVMCSREGAPSSTPQSRQTSYPYGQTAGSSNPRSQPTGPTTPRSQPARGEFGLHYPSDQSYGRQTSHGGGYPSTPGSAGPAQAPPSYADVQTHRDQTKLEEQIANMNIKRDYDQPSQPSQPDYGRQSSGSYGHQASEYDRQPSTNYGRQTSDYGGGRDFGRQSSHGYQPSPQPAPHTPTYTPQSPSAYYGNQQPAYTPPSPAAPVTHKPIPDAILNMAAKGDPNRKPFTYTPDADVIKEQRDRVRRKPGGAMPRYQQMLNMPQFDDSVLTPKSPQTPPQVAPQSPTYDAGPGDATVQHLQYNSPMGLYSNNNMAEAFEGQTDGVVTGASGDDVPSVTNGNGVKTDQNKDITQSPVYRMIHGLDANKPKSRPAPPAEAQYRPVQDDEMTFSGIGHKNDVPSRSFQKLQNMTSGSEVDTSSIRGNVTGGTDDEVSDYDQASIRYTGRNIPSKSFRMLQSMTGDDPSSLGVPGQQRRQRRKPQAPPSPDQDPDDVVDIRYVGGSIPSQAFRALQHLTGDDQTTGPFSGAVDDSCTGQGRNVKVIKLRQQAPSPTGVTDF